MDNGKVLLSQMEGMMAFMGEVARRIVVSESVRFGKPVIRGTRVAVATVLGHIAAGDTPEAVAADYDISVDDVRACLAYRARYRPKKSPDR